MNTINIIHGDGVKALEAMEENQYDLAIVDPPYFDGPNKLGYYGEVKSKTKVKRQSYSTVGLWKVPGDLYHDELLRISREQIIWGINYYNFKNVKSGRIVCDKKNDSSTFSDGEIASCSSMDTVRFFRYLWNGMLQEDMKNKEIRIHVTQKPAALYKWLLKNYAKPGDKIIDTHGGSMSHAIACIDMGFSLDIYELDSDYYKAAVDRIKRHLNQLDLSRPECEVNFIEL